MKGKPLADPELNELLREWKPDAGLPPRFQEAVWRRIESAELEWVPPSLAWWDRFLRSLLRPKWATAGLLAVVILGSLSGFRSGADQARRASQDRYVAAVDPFQKGH